MELNTAHSSIIELEPRHGSAAGYTHHGRGGAGSINQSVSESAIDPRSTTARSKELGASGAPVDRSARSKRNARGERAQQPSGGRRRGPSFSPGLTTTPGRDGQTD